jgi:hypothetical protein
MGRRNKDLGTGKPKLQETSLPSLLMVLNQDALDTDDFSLILKTKGPLWIITRDNRIRGEQIQEATKAGIPFREFETPVKQNAFKLYRLR